MVARERKEHTGDGLGVFRAVLYAILWIFSVILMGITAARIAHTEPAFYEPIVVELLVVSVLLIGASTLFGILVCIPSGGRGMTRIIIECITLTILWLMLLIGAAVATSRFPSLNRCIRFTQCNLLRSMLAFAWMCWIIVTFLLGLALADAFMTNSHDGDGAHNWNGRNTEAIGPNATGPNATGPNATGPRTTGPSTTQTGPGHV